MTEGQRTVAILFADICGSVEVYEAVGDVEAHRRVAESLAFMKSAIERHGGTLLRTVGDSSLASFPSADEAFLAACAMQELHVDGPLSLRVGFHVGPVIHDGGDVYGHAVNVAARVASFARTDEIAVSEDVVAVLSGEHRRRMTLLDRREIKGLSEPLAIHRLEWQHRDAAVTEVAASPSALTTADGRLDIVCGGRRLTVDSSRPAIVIGRSPDCDLPVDDACASRRHARIELRRGQFLLSDESTNGTWLIRNGRPDVLLRRDTIVLDGDGRLGLGATAADADSLPLAFRLTSD